MAAMTGLTQLSCTSEEMFDSALFQLSSLTGLQSLTLRDCCNLSGNSLQVLLPHLPLLEVRKITSGTPCTTIAGCTFVYLQTAISLILSTLLKAILRSCSCYHYPLILILKRHLDLQASFDLFVWAWLCHVNSLRGCDFMLTSCCLLCCCRRFVVHDVMYFMFLSCVDFLLVVDFMSVLTSCCC